MKSLSRHIAWRYLHNTAAERTTCAMVRVCFISILIGSFSLTLVTAVMRGFEVTIHEKMQGIHAQATVDVEGDMEDLQDAVSQLRALPNVAAASASALAHTLILNDPSGGQPTVVGLKGVDPHHESLVSAIPQKLIKSQHKKPFAKLLEDNQVIIGKKLAEMLDIGIGDTLSFSYAKGVRSQGKKLIMGSKEAVVTGIFKSGVDDVDAGLVYASLPFVESLESSPPSLQVGLSFTPGSSEEKQITKLNATVPWTAYSWKERYASLMAALMIEKYAMFFVIALITLVASMNIISLLFMQITNKRADIAILKAMGMATRAIRAIFLQLGLGIAALASLVGILLACGVVLFLNYYPLIKLPDVYHTSHLPAHLDWYVPPLVFVVVMLISLLATWFPARRIRYINIARVLRFEG